MLSTELFLIRIMKRKEPMRRWSRLSYRLWAKMKKWLNYIILWNVKDWLKTGLVI